MKELWKIAVTTGIVLGILCFGVMFIYGTTKSIVITEEQDLMGQENLKPLADYLMEEKKKYKFVVLINSAHGGGNKGNVVNELQEKEITLEVGKKLEEMSVEGETGIFLIRQEDKDVSNESRAELTERVQPNLLIDLHVNADAVNERTQGTAVLYNDSFYRPDLTNAELADLIERNLVTKIQGKALGIFSDDTGKYPILHMVTVPSVSIEIGYLTNKQEAELLGKDSYQKKIALGIFAGIQEAKERWEEEKNEK